MAQPCPECKSELAPLRLDPGSVSKCARCGGMCVNAAVLKRHAPDALMVRVWSAARAGGTASHRACPGCSQPLRTFASDGFSLDSCRSCQLLWLDAGELEGLGVRLRAAKAPDDTARAHAHATTELQRDAREPFSNEESFLICLIDELTAFFMR